MGTSVTDEDVPPGGDPQVIWTAGADAETLDNSESKKPRPGPEQSASEELKRDVKIYFKPPTYMR
ncbi:hypothetical protein EVJ58_g3932 [Rhodofomes roseus]|uniref:Uncharacterized protein n=1 Tax=Rhodofomes roseus TaxID=34475 RepID=A0A4Y9YKI8_9APHY|nr:hypothetical protein EVJ58_g3932 [Rhodofomes roseus]